MKDYRFFTYKIYGEDYFVDGIIEGMFSGIEGRAIVLLPWGSSKDFPEYYYTEHGFLYVRTDSEKELRLTEGFAVRLLIEQGIEDEFSEKLGQNEIVNKPPHYQSGNGLEAIDVIESFGLGFNLGNVVKYVLRAGKKDASKKREDLKKAAWYINRELQKEDN